jgi:hypothetical protein
LLALGYGTAFAPEMDEGERVVDSPVERRTGGARERPTQTMREPVAPTPAAREGAPARAGGESAGDSGMATEKQLASIHKLCETLGKPEPQGALTNVQARELISQLSREYQARQSVRRAS